MRLNKRKGQGISLTGAAVIVFLAIFLALVIYILAIATSNTFDDQVSESINYRIEEVEVNSVLVTALQDRMYHLPEDFSSEYGPHSEDSSEDYKEFYKGRTPYKVISYYFSTPQGEDVWIGGDNIAKSDVKDDLKEYFRARFKPLQDTSDEDYFLRIYNPDGDDSEQIQIRSNDEYTPTSSHLRITSSIAIRDGEKAILTLWSKSATGVTSVGG